MMSITARAISLYLSIVSVGSLVLKRDIFLGKVCAREAPVFTMKLNYEHISLKGNRKSSSKQPFCQTLIPSLEFGVESSH